MKSLSPGVISAALILVYVVGMTASNIFLKFAADASGLRSWMWFIAGNAAGFLCPVTITFALRNGPPHLVYASAIAGGFCVLQVVSVLIFHTTLAPAQCAGIGLVAIGLFLLQWGV